MADQRAGREVYSQAENPAFEAWVASRTAAREAAFFLPHLRPGTKVLDVGCGPGTITLGLAEVVAPGDVVGIDFQSSQIQRARDLAAKRGVVNARFEVGDAYRLPFRDNSFDAVFAHAILMHLREPVRALADMRRVLRPGGIVGVRDPDYGTILFTPATPLLDHWRTLMIRLRQHSGGDPFIGRHLRRLLLEGGFIRAEASGSAWSAGSPEETRRSAVIYRAWSAARVLVTDGLVTQATLDAMGAAFDAWAERPNAFHVLIWGEAVGWKGD